MKDILTYWDNFKSLSVFSRLAIVRDQFPTLPEANAYIFRHKGKILYGPQLVLTYGALWVYYDRSDIRRFAQSNPVTLDQEILIVRVLYGGLAATLPGMVLFLVLNFGLFLSSRAFWTRIDYNCKLTIFGIAVAVLYGIIIFVVPASFVLFYHRNGEVMSWIPELFLGSRLSLYFYISHFCCMRLHCQPEHFPGWFAFYWVYLYAFLSLIQLTVETDQYQTKNNVLSILVQLMLSVPNWYYSLNFLWEMYKKKRRIDKQESDYLEQTEMRVKQKEQGLFIKNQCSSDGLHGAQNMNRDNNNFRGFTSTASVPRFDQTNANVDETSVDSYSQDMEPSDGGSGSMPARKECFTYEERTCIYICCIIGSIFFVALALAFPVLRFGSIGWVLYLIVYQAVLVFGWQRLSSITTTNLCFDSYQSLAREQSVSDAREKLLLQVSVCVYIAYKWV